MSLQDQNLNIQVQTIIDEEIRPKLQLHNGDIEFIDLKDNIVYLSFKGACAGCPFSAFTFTLGIQELLQQRIPALKDVVII